MRPIHTDSGFEGLDGYRLELTGENPCSGTDENDQLMMHLDEQESQLPSTGASDEVVSLVERARSGDRYAFEQLIDLYHKDIFRMVYYRTRSQMDSEDLTQDVFLQVLKHLPNLKDPERFKSWIYSIAVNRVRDFIRKKRLLSLFGITNHDDEPEQPDRGTHEDPGALDQLIRYELWQNVRQFSTCLSTLEREVFFLRFLDHLNIVEIAHALKKSESTIKTHLYRSIRKFREDERLMQVLRGGTI